MNHNQTMKTLGLIGGTSWHSTIEYYRIIQQELTFGRIKADSKQYVMDSVASMIGRGAKGVVLGCTEFPLMISASDLDVPIFNTTEIHALAAVRWILGSNTG